MAKIFNKRSIKHILSSTALIGALLFSNTVSVSAEEATPVEDNIVEVEQSTDKSNTYELEDNGPVEGAEEPDDSEVDKKSSDEDLPKEPEASSETDGNTESDQANESESPSDNNGEPEKDDIENDEEPDTDELEDTDELPKNDESKEDSSTDEGTKKEDSPENEEEINNKDNMEDKEETDSEDTDKKPEKEDDEVEDDSEKDPEKEDKEEDPETDSDESQEDPASKQNQVFSSLMSTYSTTRTQSIQNDGDFVERISGADRFEIAAAISQRGWSSSDTVFITNGFKDADALTGSPLASAHDVPILFTRATHVPGSTLNEIRRLGASNVVIIGGNDSVPAHITETLENNSLKVQRINGSDRYHLAAEVADEVMEVEGKNRDAYLVNGDAYADAVSVAPVASAKRLPIFLTHANNLHDTVKTAIPYVNSWNILGGTASISENVIQEMINLGADISRRFDGKNRYEVNRNVIQFYGTGGESTYVASGEEHADALATAGLAGKEGKNILLVKDNNVVMVPKPHNFKHLNKMKCSKV